MSMLVVLLLACVTEASFPDQVASLACARSEECYRSDFESLYDDRKDCVEEQSDTFTHINDCYRDHCDFDAADANDYLAELRTAECDDAGAALGDVGGVYDDCQDEWDLFACLAGF